MRRVYIPARLRQSVMARADGRYEFCLLHQDDTPFTHQIDHFIPVKHGGQTVSANLVVACLECNRYKGSDIAAFDPVSGDISPLFHPRTQIWTAHFTLQDAWIIGQTPPGRATVVLLRLNSMERLIQRQTLMRIGRYPIFLIGK